MGLGLEQTIQYVYREAPTFEVFEDWILAICDNLDKEKIDQFNSLFSGDPMGKVAIVEHRLLSKEDWDFWQETGISSSEMQ